MRLEDLPTPCLVLDQVKLGRNIAAMRSRLAQHRVPLRPHMKTAKSIDVARLVLEGQPPAVTVSTLREAAYFLEHGIRDILYTVGIVPQKLLRVAELQRAGARISVVLDDPGLAAAVGREAQRLAIRVPALIEIDSDGHRAGLQPGDGAAIEAVARALVDSPGTELLGVMTHAGESYNYVGADAIRAIAEQERRAVTDVAARLRVLGMPCPVVSVGSTPTATFFERLDGVTEVRAGVYMFQDLVMAGLGVCGIESLALSVLGTVIGHKPEHGRILIDAGGMALSKDRGTAAQGVDQRFGLVCDAATGAVVDGYVVDAANQEHGIVTRRSGKIDYARFPLGSRVRVLPNHACMTAAAHERYFVVDGGDEVVAIWPRCNYW